ncbi:Protochlorophyllide-dependent translocon component 52 protein [Thalictrum thalictroides]|uniref:Protochlorophyllide-dependent translocon component 52 protein n=1 Tax=Thalictrum thalictroides TaxID=46969 RepID=A0A7J6WCI2_THATH|nr:Protochlorophyllide-dependent translocon component 52 protein [Thalictrum thalictroides]
MTSPAASISGSCAHQSERNVFQCFVFGPTKAGNSALLNSFLGRPFAENYAPTTTQRSAANVVEQFGEHKINDVGPSNWLKVSFVPTKADAMVIAFRQWLRKYSGGQFDWGTKFSGYLPPTPPKEQLLERCDYKRKVLCSPPNFHISGYFFD